jgi:transposase-like protein
MECPEYKSDHINKNGHRGQKQNYICVNCGRQFIDSYETNGYSDDVKRTCLKMYLVVQKSPKPLMNKGLSAKYLIRASTFE